MKGHFCFPSGSQEPDSFLLTGVDNDEECQSASRPLASTSFQSSCFGPYKLLAEINRGATAVVYEAVDRRNAATHVALKVLGADYSNACTLPEGHILREIQCISKTSHRNVAKLLNVVKCQGHVGLAMELVRGPDLLDYVQECGRKVPEEVAVHYFRQLLDAVAYLHFNGIAHLDLKPENCMINIQEHKLKVIDFGLARPIDAKVPLGCGTIYTIAPECIMLGKAQTGFPDPIAVDLWGLGVTLYIMLVGQFPFQDIKRPHDDQINIRNTLLGNLNPIPKHISPAATHLLLSLLNRDPAMRPSLLDISTHEFVQKRVHLQKVFRFEEKFFAKYRCKLLLSDDLWTGKRNSEDRQGLQKDNCESTTQRCLRARAVGTDLLPESDPQEYSFSLASGESSRTHDPQPRLETEACSARSCGPAQRPDLAVKTRKGRAGCSVNKSSLDPLQHYLTL